MERSIGRLEVDAWYWHISATTIGAAELCGTMATSRMASFTADAGIAVMNSITNLEGTSVPTSSCSSEELRRVRVSGRVVCAFDGSVEFVIPEIVARPDPDEQHEGWHCRRGGQQEEQHPAELLSQHSS